MAFFERSDLNGLKMNYVVVRGVVPSDTLFIHGNLASNTWWEPGVQVWSARPDAGKLPGSLILAEWRGCGRSGGPRTEADLDMKAMARDYVELLKELKVAKANVVGHSTGGLIALLAMAQAPGLFARAVLLDPVAATGFQITPELKAAFEQMSKDRALTAAVMGGTIHGNDPASPLFQRIVDDAFGIDPKNWFGVPAALSQVDYRPELKTVRQPTLVLHGEHDVLLNIQESQETAQLLPEGRFQKLDGQGHSCNVENPARFVELVDRFLFG